METASHRLSSRTRRTPIALALAAATVLAASEAAAGTSPAQLYDQAVTAESRGRHDEAARLFARADAAAPNGGALAAALEAAIKSGNAALAMELVERAEARGARGHLAKAKDAAKKKFADRAGKLETSCETCTLTVDGREMAKGRGFWLTVGSHTIEITGEKGATATRKVAIIAGEVATIDPPAPPPPPPPRATPQDGDAKADAPPEPEVPEAPKQTGISQGWFWAGLAVTAGAAVATGLSAKDAGRWSDVAAETKDAPFAIRGQHAADTRTKVLGATAALLGATTVGIGIFAVRWRSAPAEVKATVTPDSAMLRVVGRF